MSRWDIIFAAYLLFINAAAFALMGADKRRAEQNEWRIRERTLFFVAALFGGLGASAGMFFSDTRQNTGILGYFFRFSRFWRSRRRRGFLR